MAQYVFSMHQVKKVVTGKKVILDNISLSFLPGAKIGVLGLNGAGKSTLLKIMAGLDNEFEGMAKPAKGIKIGYLAQEPILDPNKNVKEVIEEAIKPIKNAQKELDQIYDDYTKEDADFDALAKEQAKLENFLQAHDAHNIQNQLEKAADALRLPDFAQKISSLSGGQKRRVALCRLLLEKPDMLLLDEPTNHLDAASVAWLERFLEEYKGTVVAITHDRYFLDNVATWILELDRGQGFPYEGNYSNWLDAKSARLAHEEGKQKSHAKAMKEELEWVRSNAKARQSKSKARLAKFEQMQTLEYQRRNETNEIFIPPGQRLGDKVLEITNISKAYDKNLLIKDFSFKVPKGAIVGIVGANGVGKSTLFSMILGKTKPDSGQIELGETVKVAAVDQFREHLDDQKTVWEEISEKQDIIKVGTFEMNSRTYVGRFNFSGVGQQKNIGALSGGERNRVHLAKLLKTGGNFLLLDEPSNDLDVETLRALENALLEFAGSALVISHDRWFLDRIATHILEYKEDGKIESFEGNYSEYIAWQKENNKFTKSKRVKFKKI